MNTSAAKKHLASLSISIVCLAVIWLPIALGQSDRDREQLTRDAMAEAFGTNDAARIADMLASASAGIEENATQRPDERLSASALIVPGADAHAVANLVESHDLELAGAEFKAPGGNGTTFTLGLSADVLLQGTGDTYDRLEHGLALARQMITMAEPMTEPVDLPRRIPLVSRPIRIFKIEVIGSGRSLGDLTNSAGVLAVLPHRDDQKIKDYDYWKSLLEENR